MEESKMKNGRILTLWCIYFASSMYGMDYDFKDKQLLSKPIERVTSRQVTFAAPQSTVAVQKASSTPYDVIAPVAMWVNDPKQPEQEKIDQTVQLTKYECMSMPLTEQVQMIEQLQLSLDKEKEALVGLKRLQGKSYDPSLKYAIDCNERSIRISHEQIKACSCICAKTIQTQLARCQDTESKLALMKTLNTVHAKFKDNLAAKEVVCSCESALVKLQQDTVDPQQQAAGASSKQEYSEEKVLKAQEQIRADEQRAVLEFSTALNKKCGLCKTLQAKAKLIFELLAMQESFERQQVPQGVIELCKAKISMNAQNIQKELSVMSKLRPDWLHDSYGARFTGSKPIEHAWQNFQTAVYRIKKCFTELTENKGALSSVRIEQLHQAKEACQKLAECIRDLCCLGSDQVSSQDMSVTRKEREQLESTTKKLVAITELFTKHMKVLPEVAPQANYSSSYHEESESGVVQEETMLERNKPKIIGALGGICSSGLLNYCGINATIAIAWGTGVMTVSGGVGLCIGGAIWAALEVKQLLDRRAQTEVHLRTPISSHVYKIGEPETDIVENVSAYIRKQQVLQQARSTQPARSDDAVLQADGVTLLPKEAVQQPAKPAEAASALVSTDKQKEKQQDKPSEKVPAKEESLSITEDQKQGATQIPVLLDVLASTPSGSVSVDAVSAKKLKQEEHLSAALHDIAIITLEELKRTPPRVLNVKRLLENVAAGFKDKWRQAFVAEIIDNKADLDILRALLRTDALDPAIEQQERLYQAAVKPYLDETKQSIEDFMGLPWQEKYRIVIGSILEQASTVVLFHTAGRYIRVVRKKLPELVKFISEDKPLSAVQTPEGMRFVVETTPEFGTSPEAASLMESEKPLSGSTKVPQPEVAPAADVTLTEIAKDLKCDEQSALQQLKEYFSKGTVIENRVEAAIDADTKIVFRKDYGEKYAHPLKTKRGYPAGVKIDHYNIDVCERSHPGTDIDNWTHHSIHIVFDEEGKNIIDFF
jgi:hypothetical protein